MRGNALFGDEFDREEWLLGRKGRQQVGDVTKEKSNYECFPLITLRPSWASAQRLSHGNDRRRHKDKRPRSNISGMAANAPPVPCA